jgi:hypothetical protein
MPSTGALVRLDDLTSADDPENFEVLIFRIR